MPYLRRTKARVSSRTRSAPHTARRKRVEIAGFAGAGILVDESVGGEQDGGAVAADAAHDLARLQGRGMAHHLHARDQRQQGADRQAEAMEHGQGIEQHIARIKVDMGPHLGHIGQDIGVGKRHALGLAFGAGGEQDRRRSCRDRVAPPPGAATACPPPRSACPAGKDRRAHLPDRRSRIAQARDAQSSSPARSMKRRAVTTRLTCAVRSALFRPASAGW